MFNNLKVEEIFTLNPMIHQILYTFLNNHIFSMFFEFVFILQGNYCLFFIIRINI